MQKIVHVSGSTDPIYHKNSSSYICYYFTVLSVFYQLSLQTMTRIEQLGNLIELKIKCGIVKEFTKPTREYALCFNSIAHTAILTETTCN